MVFKVFHPQHTGHVNLLAEQGCSVELPGTHGGLASSAWPFSWSRLWNLLLQHVNVTVLYSATVILVEGALKRLTALGLIPQLIKAIYPDRVLVEALTIARSIDYCMQSTSGRSAQVRVLFPMRMAWHALLGVKPAVALWLQEVLCKIRCFVPGDEGIGGYVLKLGISADLVMAN